MSSVNNSSSNGLWSGIKQVTNSTHAAACVVTNIACDLLSGATGVDVKEKTVEWTAAVAAKIKPPTLKIFNKVVEPIRLANESVNRRFRPNKDPQLILPNIAATARQVENAAPQIKPDSAFTAFLDRSRPPESNPLRDNQEALKREQARNKPLIDQHLKKIGERATDITAFYQLEQWCGIEEAQCSALLEIIETTRAAREEANPRSVWSIFRTKHPGLTFFQYIKAGLFYWLFYKSSFISTLIENILPNLQQAISGELKNPEAISLFFKKMISRVATLLRKDIKAHRIYAENQDERDLDIIRKEIHAKGLNGTLKKPLTTFLKKVISVTDLKIPILRWISDNIPLLGIPFKWLEGFINRFIVKKTLNKVLPKLSMIGIENLLEKIQNPTSYIPLKLNFARVVKRQLQAYTDNPLDSSENITPLSGTEELKKVVAFLEEALHLASVPKTDSTIAKTPLVVKRRITEWDQKQQERQQPADYRTAALNFISPALAYPERTIDKSITETIIEGGNQLFSYLNKGIQSDQLLGIILSQAELFLTSPPIIYEESQRDYQIEKKELNQSAKETFEASVAKGVNRAIETSPSTDVNKPAFDSFEERKSFASLVFQKLAELSGKMLTKQKNKEDMGVDIATFAKISRSFTEDLRIKSSLPLEDPQHKNAIHGALYPLYSRFSTVQQDLQILQQLQVQYNQAKTTQSRLDGVKTILENCLSEPNIRGGKVLKNIEDILAISRFFNGEEDPYYIHGRNQIIGRIAKQWDAEFKSVQSLEALPALISKLSQLQSRSFFAIGKGECEEEITTCLQALPEAERQQLTELINTDMEMTQKGLSNKPLEIFYARLLQEHRVATVNAFRQLSEGIEFNLEQINQKIQGHTHQFTNPRNEALAKQTQKIATEMKSLSEDTANLKLSLIPVSTPGLAATLGKTIQAGAVTGMGVMTAAGIGVITPGVPVIAAAATAAPIAAKLAQKAIQASAYYRTYPKVEELFDSAYNYCIDETVTSTMILHILSALLETVAERSK